MVIRREPTTYLFLIKTDSRRYTSGVDLDLTTETRSERPELDYWTSVQGSEKPEGVRILDVILLCWFRILFVRPHPSPTSLRIKTIQLP